jgi:hypothetical protein
MDFAFILGPSGGLTQWKSIFTCRHMQKQMSKISFWIKTWRRKILGFHGGDYEEEEEDTILQENNVSGE